MNQSILGQSPLLRLRRYRAAGGGGDSAWADLDRTDVVWCPALDLGCVDPMPTADDLARYYAGAYRRSMGKSRNFEGHVTSPDRLVRAESQAAWVEAFVNETGSWLDVGAGYGLLLSQVATLLPQWERCAVEPDESARDTLARVASRRFDHALLWDDVEGLGRTFDVISLSHVLEHLIDPLHALRILHKHLKPGGFLMLEVPNDHLVEMLRRERANDLPHLWFFSLPGLRHLAARAGFEVVRGAELGLRRPGVYAPLANRVARYLKRRFRGDAALRSDLDWYREEADRTDVRLLCWKPDRVQAAPLRSVERPEGPAELLGRQ